MIRNQEVHSNGPVLDDVLLSDQKVIIVALKWISLRTTKRIRSSCSVDNFMNFNYKFFKKLQEISFLKRFRELAVYYLWMHIEWLKFSPFFELVKHLEASFFAAQNTWISPWNSIVGKLIKYYMITISPGLNS